MRDTFHGLIKVVLKLEPKPDALAIPVAHDWSIKRLPHSARYHLFPAHREVLKFLCSNGILSTQGKEIILKEMKEEDGD